MIVLNRLWCSLHCKNCWQIVLSLVRGLQGRPKNHAQKIESAGILKSWVAANLDSLLYSSVAWRRIIQFLEVVFRQSFERASFLSTHDAYRNQSMDCLRFYDWRKKTKSVNFLSQKGKYTFLEKSRSDVGGVFPPVHRYDGSRIFTSARYRNLLFHCMGFCIYCLHKKHDRLHH